MPKLKYPAKSHPGKAGRKPASFPEFTKKLRATEEEQKEFMDMLTGDATSDFVILVNLLRTWHGRGVAWCIEAKWRKKYEND